MTATPILTELLAPHQIHAPRTMELIFGPAPLGVLYRYHATASYSDHLGWRVNFFLTHYPILKRTERGAWIHDDTGRRRFVLDASHKSEKRWAYADRALAWESFLIRKMRQEQHIKTGLERIRAIRDAAERSAP